MEQTIMKEERIPTLVLSRPLPMVVSMAVNSLYNIIDGYFAAKFCENPLTELSPARYVVIVIPAVFLLDRIRGAKGVRAALAAAEFLAAIFAYIAYRSKGVRV